MGLLSVFKRNREAAAPPASRNASAVPAQQARARARQRLIGAVVLVIAAIIVFPLLFETQPRPVAVDIPIEIPRPDNAPPLTMPGAAPEATLQGAGPAQREAAAPKEDPITEAPGEAGREVPATQPAPPTARQETAKAERPAAEAPSKRPTERAAPAAPQREADRAQALLEGKAAPAASDKAKEPAKDGAKDRARYIVQVGAFADASAARDVRAKVEKLGYKTYTQVAQTSAGNRVRVRVGPFDSRDQADKVAGRIKSAGLQSVVLTL